MQTTAIGLAQSITGEQTTKLLGQFFSSGLRSSESTKINIPSTNSYTRAKRTVSAIRQSQSRIETLTKNLDLSNAAIVLDAASKFINTQA